MSTEPLNLDMLFETLYALKKSREVGDRPQPSTTVDFGLLHQHGIGYFIEGDLVLFSSEGLRRAREVGAVTSIPHNSHG